MTIERNRPARIPTVKDAAEQALLFAIHAGRGIPEPVRQYQFAPPRKWRADFCWPEHHLIVEVDGGIWAQGRHTRGAGVEADMEKLGEAAIRGYYVIKVSTGSSGMVEDGRALDLIERFFAALPHPPR